MLPGPGSVTGLGLGDAKHMGGEPPTQWPKLPQTKHPQAFYSAAKGS